jgi:hypothetical protein
LLLKGERIRKSNGMNLIKVYIGKFQDGDYREVTGSINSINLETCRDAGAILGRKKTTKNKQNSEIPNPQPLQGFSTPCYIEKTGGLPCCQTPPAPNVLGRCGPTGERISTTWYSHSHPLERPA